MRVAVIGTGNMATGLGRQFAAAGHEVIVGSRDPERAGVDVDALALRLQQEGAEAFERSWHGLLECIARKTEVLVGAR